MEQSSFGALAHWLGKHSHRIGVPIPRPVEYAPGEPPRVLFYCASNIGLGHLGRTLRVIERLRAIEPGVNILLVTDARDLSIVPANEPLATLKLPAFEFDGSPHFGERPRGLTISNKQLQGLRQNTLLAAASSFRPHALYCDTLPHGKRDELLPTIKFLHRMRPRPRIVLCMRDIPAAPGEKFKFNEAPDLLERHLRYYDRILIAGDERFFDVAGAYSWPESVRRKLEYAGFMVDSPIRTEISDTARIVMGEAPRTIVASFGGGWEAAELAPPIVNAIEALGARGMNLQLRLFTGPAIREADFASLQAEIEDMPNIRIEKVSTDFSATLGRADLAILLAGSTPFQVLESSMPMLVYFRDYKDSEQALRAERLASFPGVQLLSREQMNPLMLADLIGKALVEPRAPRNTGLKFNGAEVAAAHILGSSG